MWLAGSTTVSLEAILDYYAAYIDNVTSFELEYTLSLIDVPSSSICLLILWHEFNLYYIYYSDSSAILSSLSVVGSNWICLDAESPA